MTHLVRRGSTSIDVIGQLPEEEAADERTELDHLATDAAVDPGGHRAGRRRWGIVVVLVVTGRVVGLVARLVERRVEPALVGGEGRLGLGFGPVGSPATLVHGWVRSALLVPTLYLAAFVWENVLLPQPDTTRYIVLGALLIALMIIRPNGLLGERRVEIV